MLAVAVAAHKAMIQVAHTQEAQAELAVAVMVVPVTVLPRVRIITVLLERLTLAAAAVAEVVRMAVRTVLARQAVQAL